MTCEIAAYTFDPLGGYWTNPMKPFQYWDNYSVVVDPKTRSALHGAMSLVMATHEHEVQMLQRLRGASATMIYNGAPLTRTWSQTFKPSDAMYFAETVRPPTYCVTVAVSVAVTVGQYLGADMLVCLDAERAMSCAFHAPVDADCALA